MKARGFGANAERRAAAFEPSRTTLLVEAEAVLDGFAAAVELRCAGEAFDLMIFEPDRRAAVASIVATQIVAEKKDYDDRRFALDALAHDKYDVRGASTTAMQPHDFPTRSAMRELLRLAERTIVRSWTEWRRIVFQLGYVMERVEVVRIADPTVPSDVSRSPDGSVVVWAPSRRLDRLAIIAMAMRELRRPVTFVCEGESIEGLAATIVPFDDAAEALRRASVVVVADDDDPAPACALARLSIPVCVSSTSGAHEFLVDAPRYRPWHRGSVVDAVLCALGSPAALDRPNRNVPDDAPTAPATVLDPPLVSVVVRTYDRREFLHRTLASIAAQTYPRIETIVVNDGGPSVSDIVRDFGNIRLIDQPANDYRRATNVGMRATAGMYVARIDDDDFIFPDHFSHLVDALERSKRSIAFADMLITHVEGDGPDSRVTGYAMPERVAIQPAKMLAINQIMAPGLRALFRRATLERLGWFSESIYIADDYELLLRFLKIDDFVHVDRITALYTRSADGTNLSASKDRRLAEAHRLIAVLHPVGDRPRLIDARRQILEYLERNGPPAVRPSAWRFAESRPLPGFQRSPIQDQRGQGPASQ